MRQSIIVFCLTVSVLFTTTNTFADNCSGNCTNGFGIMTYSDGSEYVGEWRQGKRHGQGYFTYANGINRYVGEFTDGSMSGGDLIKIRSDFTEADIAAGKSKSAMCAACHGYAGISEIPMYPNLAGQKEAYLVKQLKGFKSGKRQDAVMAPMAKILSDADIKNLAAYYASLK